MEQMFNNFVNSNFSWMLDNKLVITLISLFLGMYAGIIRPKLPSFIENLFENPVFRLIMISFIIYKGNEDPQLSLMIALAFLATMHMINRQRVESFPNHQASWEREIKLFRDDYAKNKKLYQNPRQRQAEEELEKAEQAHEQARLAHLQAYRKYRQADEAYQQADTPKTRQALQQASLAYRQAQQRAHQAFRKLYQAQEVYQQEK